MTRTPHARAVRNLSSAQDRQTQHSTRAVSASPSTHNLRMPTAHTPRSLHRQVRQAPSRAALASLHTANSSNAEGHQNSLQAESTSTSPVLYSNALGSLSYATPTVRSEPFTGSLHAKVDTLLE